jgi:PAS domain S-box-containing protein
MDDLDGDRVDEPQVALGVARRRNRELLRDLLDGYDVVEVTDEVPPESDLCLVDAGGFDRLRDALVAWKRAERPLTAPVLLVANTPEGELWTRYGEAVGASLDAVLSVPAPRRAVRTRVDGLVQAREQAVLAAARYDRLALYERAMDGAQVGITIADATRDDLPMVYVNDGFCELTGYDREETLGRNCRFLQGDGTDPETRRRIRAALAAEEPVSVEIRNYRKDGEPFWNRLDILPVGEDGTVTHFLGFQRDVSAVRRQRERLSVLDRVLRHNLRNKLNVVAGHARTLRDDPDRDPAAVERTAEHIERAATDVLELADAARRFRLDAEADAAAQADVAARVAAWAATETDVVTDLPDRAPALCPTQLRLCLDTLVENARGRHPTGTPTVTVTVERGATDVTVTVSDDAEPIPEVERRAFDAGRETALEHAQGIDLWLVRWTVERAGGEVDLGADGRTVTLTLPAVGA